ncbi:aminoglycoside phosphotransferase family protein [Kiritimatiellota bacterium B12222]|nr:aminoglycoside phosphotransferase family protein [Kiritimatiellota bacterium B12222]
MSPPDHVLAQFTNIDNLNTVFSLGRGHINDTYLVSMHAQDPFVVQRVNQVVFHDVPGMMRNIRHVTDHQQLKLRQAQVSDQARRSLRMIQSTEGDDFCVDQAGNYWRAFQYIPGMVSIDVVDNARQVFEAARAFGAFQAQMSDLPGELIETIPGFHHTPSRLEALEQSFDLNESGRASQVKAEMEFVHRHRSLAHLVAPRLEAGELPVRVTHNDTKINNVLFDEESGEGICVIDLDTVMPGSLLYDFGDLVRTATSLADEDEADVDKITIEMDLFTALVDGFMQEAGSFISSQECALLPQAGALISFELGMRFLKDYLEGDRYFKVAHPQHNLQRCRAQFRRAEGILRLEKELTELVADRC